MKTIVSLLIIMVASIASIHAQTTTVKGTLSGTPEASSIVLENFLQPTAYTQTVEIKDNAFSFTLDITQEDIFKLRLSQKNYLGLVIKPGEKITLKLNASLLNTDPIITGSEQTVLLYSTEKTLTKIAASQDSLNKVYATVSSDATRKKEIEDQYYAFEAQKSTLLYGVITSHPDYLVNMFFIERLDIDKYYEVYKLVDSALGAKYPYNPAVVSLHSKVQSSKATAIGSAAPEINLPTPKGELLSLYSVKSKVIIVDFWASWCRPCRAENPNMTKLYADYHSKGLEIFGVSLDKDSAAWVKAIADDKLVWYHVSDLKFWSSVAAAAYGVGSIPSMFVLDADKKIIAKNLRGEELRKFVSGKLD